MSTNTSTPVRSFSNCPFGIHDEYLACPETDHVREDESPDLPDYFQPNWPKDDELIDLDFLAHFVDGMAFYAESLEDEIGAQLEDFWQAREHAHHIVTSLIIQRMSECGMGD